MSESIYKMTEQNSLHLHGVEQGRRLTAKLTLLHEQTYDFNVLFRGDDAPAAGNGAARDEWSGLLVEALLESSKSSVTPQPSPPLNLTISSPSKGNIPDVPEIDCPQASEGRHPYSYMNNEKGSSERDEEDGSVEKQNSVEQISLCKPVQDKFS
jgi:hypothetical protein